MSGNQDFAALKKLLISWNVEILYELFKEEDIAKEELKMIKFRHLSHLLKNYKMGVKIRFEHHFENWRNKIGKPLQGETSVMCTCHCKSSTENEQNLETRSVNKNITKRSRLAKEMFTDNLELEYSEQPPPQSPQSTKSNTSYHELTVNNEMPNLTPIPVLNSSGRQYNRKNLEQDEAVAETESLATLTQLLAASLADSPRDETQTPQKYTSKFAPDNTLPVSLAQILQLSGSRGMAIVKYYNENKHLTNTHRTQLIQTIVEFFDDNDYHLSLNMSHNLEWQLLKMFPTEKIENYRTEKRGKIYVKFSNMKRYKRERNNRTVKSETEKSHNSSNQNVSGIADSNMDTTSFDTWPEGAEVDIEIKPEVLSEDDI